MNIVTRFATLATLIVFATAVAEESNVDDRLLLARAELAGAGVAVDSVALDEYVGRYLAEGGVDFVVVHEDDALTIELPETWAVPEAKLVAEGAGDFVAEVAVRVSFERDGDGRVTGLVAHPRGEAPIAAVKMPLLRGVVTIEDVDTDETSAEAAIAHTTRRGIVTIEDVYDAPGVLSVAAAQ